VDAILELLMANRSLVELKSKRKAKTFLSIPTPVIGLRRYSITIKRLSKSIAIRSEKHITERMYNELTDSYTHQRSAFLKTVRDTNKVAAANRMYLRYR